MSESLFGVAGLLLVCDGFLVPGKSDGSVSLVPINGDPVITLSQPKSGYFYHMAVWEDLNGDGRLDLLTARATKPLFGAGSGEMLWLEQPASNPLSGSWMEHVITPGPDVMFVVCDFDNDDSTVEVVSAQFFDPSVTLQIIDRVNGTLLFSRVIDNTIGPTEGVSLVDFNGDQVLELMVNNHVSDASAGVFAYEVPADIRTGVFARHILASGFKTVAWGPGSASPGFAYAFHPFTGNNGLPHVAIAGDGAYQAYLLTPNGVPYNYTLSVLENAQGTVGALAIGDVTGDGWVEIFVPNYDKNYLSVYTFDPAAEAEA